MHLKTLFYLTRKNPRKNHFRRFYGYFHSFDSYICALLKRKLSLFLAQQAKGKENGNDLRHLNQAYRAQKLKTISA